MGRIKNEQERNRIENIAFNLFRKKGYDETSYTDIAQASGLKKSLVQYYFPKKETLISIFENKVLNAAADIVQNSNLTSDPLEQVQLIGYLIFMFLYLDNQKEHLTKAILQDRRNTMAALDEVAKWTIRYVGSEDPDFNRRLEDAIVFAAGGGCEYVYHVIVKKKDADPNDIVDNVLSEMNLLMGKEMIQMDIRSKVDEEWLQRSCHQLSKALYQL